MSRLDAVAEALGMGSEEAKRFTRAVRAQFDAAPSYAQILRALRGLGGRPSPQQVAARIRQDLTAGDKGGRGYRRLTRRPQGPRRGRGKRTG